MRPSITRASSVPRGSVAGEAAEKPGLDRRAKERTRESVRERAAELEAARATCDALAAELRTRQAHLADVEKRHGAMNRRDERAAALEAQLGEREDALTLRLQGLMDQEHALLGERRRTERHWAEREAAVKVEEGRLEGIASTLAKREEELQGAKQMQLLRQQAADEQHRVRQRALHEQEEKVAGSLKHMHHKAEEAEKARQEAADHTAALRVEVNEVQARERELKWQSDTLQGLLAAATEQKEALIADADRVAAREEAMDARGADLALQEAEVSRREAASRVKQTRLLDLETEVTQREAALQASLADLTRREAVMHKALDDTSAQQAALDKRAAELDAQAAEAAEAGRKLRRETRRVEVRERNVETSIKALSAWEVELEHRQAAVEAAAGPDDVTLGGPGAHRRLRPLQSTAGIRSGSPVLSQARQQNRRLSLGQVLSTPQSGGQSVGQDELTERRFSGGRQALAVSSTASTFNHAVTSMQLSRAQRAYLAGWSARRLVPPSRGATRQVEEELQRRLFDDTEDAARVANLLAELDAAATEFRDLACGFVGMTPDDRATTFTPAEHDKVLAAVDYEARLYDEAAFVHSVLETPLPAMRVHAPGPEYSQLRRDVERWVESVGLMARDRTHRIALSRLDVLTPTLLLLRGRVARASDRRRPGQNEAPHVAEQQIDGSDGASTRSSSPDGPVGPDGPLAVTARGEQGVAPAAKHRPRTTASRPRPASAQAEVVDWGAGQDASRRPASSGPARGAQAIPGLSKRRALLSSLPPHMRRHYARPPTTYDIGDRKL